MIRYWNYGMRKLSSAGENLRRGRASMQISEYFCIKTPKVCKKSEIFYKKTRLSPPPPLCYAKTNPYDTAISQKPSEDGYMIVMIYF